MISSIHLQLSVAGIKGSWINPAFLFCIHQTCPIFSEQNALSVVEDEADIENMINSLI
jgi:hypothetical protein